MEIVSLALTLQSRPDTPGRQDRRRERRDGSRRRVEDTAPVVAAEYAGPSIAFLTQVAAQMHPVSTSAVTGYTSSPWRCGVIADERA
jgi:hypothetical protein